MRVRRCALAVLLGLAVLALYLAFMSLVQPHAVRRTIEASTALAKRLESGELSQAECIEELKRARFIVKLRERHEEVTRVKLARRTSWYFSPVRSFVVIEMEFEQGALRSYRIAETGWGF